MIQILISLAAFFVALAIGLVSAIVIKPPESSSNQEIFLLAGIIASFIVLAAYGAFLYLKNKGIISIEKIQA